MKQAWAPDLTVFIAGDGDVVYSPKFETGSREHLELHRAQDEGLEICRRGREETCRPRSTGTCCSSLGAAEGKSLSSGGRAGHWKGGKDL